MQSIRAISHNGILTSSKKLDSRREKLQRTSWDSYRKTSKEIAELSARISVAKRMVESMEPGLKNVSEELKFFDSDPTPIASNPVSSSLSSLDSNGLRSTWEILSAREALLDGSADALHQGIEGVLHSAPEHIQLNPNYGLKMLVGATVSSQFYLAFGNSLAAPLGMPFWAQLATTTACFLVGGATALGIVLAKVSREANSKLDSLKQDLEGHITDARSTISGCSQGLDELISRLLLAAPEEVASCSVRELEFAKGLSERANTARP